MRSNKQIAFGVMFLLSLVLALSAVSALTWINPTDDATIKGSVNFNVTTISAPLNCTFSTTDDGVFASVLNSTGNQPSVNVTNNTALLTQSASTTLSAACTNATTSESGSITVTIDNGNPTCSFDTDFEFTDYQSQLGVSTVQLSTDAVTNLNYSWVLYDPEGNAQRTSTASAPTFSDTDFDDIGDFIIELNVTDQASNSNICGNKTITVGTDGKKTVAVTAAVQQKKADNTILFFVLGALAFIAFLAVAGFVAISMGKKKR